MTVWEKKEHACLGRIGDGRPAAGDDTPAERSLLRIQPEDTDNFLKLAMALKIILGRTVALADLDRAKQLLQEYLRKYLEVG